MKLSAYFAKDKPNYGRLSFVWEIYMKKEEEISLSGTLMSEVEFYWTMFSNT